MAEGWDGRERRRHPRVPVDGEIRGKIHTVASAPVVDISLTGALLELPCALKPGTVYSLRLSISPTEHLELKGRVVRSYVHGFDRNDKGEMMVMYRAAVHFVSMEDRIQALLGDLIQRIEKRALSARVTG